MILLALSLFFTEPAPLDMPRAEAYFVRDNGVRRLEDRFNRLDLWVTQTVTGRWLDGDGRLFLLAALRDAPPEVARDGTVTRGQWTDARRQMPRVRANADFPRDFRAAVEILAPCPVVRKPRAPRQLPHGYKEVYYWQDPTNLTDIVCTFLPERTNVWSFASWTLADDDDYVEQIAAFEDEFLREEFPSFVSRLKSSTEGRETLDGRRERELLRCDARHSVAAYPAWRATGAAEFEVLDALPSHGFVETLTNDFAVMRAKYAAALPTPLDLTNVLCVARIYADRDDYLDALETDGLTNMMWSAAYWSPARRELVAYLPEGGERELLRTVRHEAFHQYLSYAASMIPTSPWLNEGYAQYFEDEEDTDFDDGVELTDETADRFAAAIPALLQMDYEQFYDGTDAARHFKYRLARSVVHFIEKGADEVRLKPFEGLKAPYLETLLETRDMRQATAAAFRDEDTLKKFVAEWKKFWLKR